MRGARAVEFEKKLCLGAALIVIARLGGYLARTGDGPPGFECLGRGYVLFDAMVRITKRTKGAAQNKCRQIRRRKFMGQAQR